MANSKNTSNNICIVCCGLIVISAIVGIGISITTIYANGTSYLSEDEFCGVFPANLTSFTVVKDIWAQWHWEYDFKEFEGSIQQQCPTGKHSVNVFVSDSLSVRAERQIFSLYDEADIKDCHGNLLWVIRTGDVWDTIINGNKIKVSFELRNAANNLLAYSTGTNFLSNEIVINDLDGNQVAKMEKQFFEIPWHWDITITDHTHPVADPRVVSAIAGLVSFSGKQTDSCNNYIIYGIITLVVIACIILGTLCGELWIFRRLIINRCKEYSARESTRHDELP